MIENLLNDCGVQLKTIDKPCAGTAVNGRDEVVLDRVADQSNQHHLVPKCSILNGSLKQIRRVNNRRNR